MVIESELYPRQYLYRRVVRAKMFIDDNFAAAIALDNVSSEACFSKFHFVRLFKDIYGVTPHQYLTLVRIKAAANLLDSGASVKEACFKVGFDSIGSFTGLFKRRIGVTPAAYQRLRQNRRNSISAQPLSHVPHCFAEKKGWLAK